jgi:hypothetical protein
MAMTLAERAKYETSALKRGVMQALLEHSDLMSKLPFENVKQLGLDDAGTMQVFEVDGRRIEIDDQAIRNHQAQVEESLTPQQKIKRALETARVA